MSEAGQTAARVAVYREPIARDLPLPAYATEQAAGMDLHAALPPDQPLTLAPGARALISTGLRIILPDGYEGQVRARSGWAVQAWHRRPERARYD